MEKLLKIFMFIILGLSVTMVFGMLIYDISQSFPNIESVQQTSDSIPLLISFNNMELLKVNPNGDILDRGKVIGNDPEVVEAIREIYPLK